MTKLTRDRLRIVFNPAFSLATVICYACGRMFYCWGTSSLSPSPSLIDTVLQERKNHRVRHQWKDLLDTGSDAYVVEEWRRLDDSSG